MELTAIARSFLACSSGELQVTPITEGLINATYRVKVLGQTEDFILQRINTAIFLNPAAVVRNHDLINDLLTKSSYPGKLVRQLNTVTGRRLLLDNTHGAWRMLEFVMDAHTLLKADNPTTAFEAAKTLSEFLFYLNQAPDTEPEETLPSFVDFGKRIRDYQIALGAASTARRQRAAAAISFVNDHLTLPDQWLVWQSTGQLPRRIIHGDPKISNVLFDENNHGLCVIDLDTVMSSTLLYDYGDMARSYTNSTLEDDAQATSVFDPKMYRAVKQGFNHHLTGMLVPIEADNLDYAAQTVIFIQAVRFLTDYLNGDTYYAARYHTHNLDRTRNQLLLFTELRQYIQDCSCLSCPGIS